jgi:glycine/D-amino acid oxidase-like deaminating enzyme
MFPAPKILIIGQGIAGTVVSFILSQQQIEHVVIDNPNTNTSSQIAAGIVHPITGRRLAIAPQYNVALQEARILYEEMSKQFGHTFFEQKKILEIYADVKHRNDWLSRSADDDCAILQCSEIQQSALQNISALHGAMCIAMGHFLKIKLLLDSYKNFLTSEKKIRTEKFNYTSLQFKDENIFYNDAKYSHIIFCEGSAASLNPFFPTLPFHLCKGEILDAHIPELTEEYIINKSIYILPMGDHFFKIGSNFEWDFKDDKPTSKIRQELESSLQTIIKCNYEIINHQAAIRPTVKNREPICLWHSRYKNIGILNGLGTKGALLAPLLAKKLLVGF